MLGKKLGNTDVTLVGGYRKTGVREVRCLFSNCAANVVIGVANGDNPNTGSKVNKVVAVNIYHDRAIRIFDVYRQGCTHTGRNNLGTTFVHFLRFRTRNRSNNFAFLGNNFGSRSNSKSHSPILTSLLPGERRD